MLQQTNPDYWEEVKKKEELKIKKKDLSGKLAFSEEDGELTLAKVAQSEEPKKKKRKTITTSKSSNSEKTGMPKEKKLRKKKDPNAPKGARSAFIFFGQEIRKVICILTSRLEGPFLRYLLNHISFLHIRLIVSYICKNAIFRFLSCRIG